MDAIMSIQQVQDDTPTSPTVPQANNTGTQDPVIQLTKLVQTLQEKVDKMTQPQAPPKNLGSAIVTPMDVATIGDAIARTRDPITRMKQLFEIAWEAAISCASQ